MHCALYNQTPHTVSCVQGTDLYLADNDVERMGNMQLPGEYVNV